MESCRSSTGGDRNSRVLVYVSLACSVLAVSAITCLLPLLNTWVNELQTEFQLEMHSVKVLTDDCWSDLMRLRAPLPPARLRRQQPRFMRNPPNSDGTWTQYKDNPGQAPATAPETFGFPQNVQKQYEYNEFNRNQDTTTTDSYRTQTIKTDPPIVSTPASQFTNKPDDGGGKKCDCCQSAPNECAPGVPGPPGPAGMDGEQGMNGLPGKPGTDWTPYVPNPNILMDLCAIPCPAGPKGPSGYPGEIGPPGVRGLDGQDGQNGAIGEHAVPGEDGPPGSYGSLGQPGQKGVTGRDGTKALPGPKGTRGDKGLPGLAGIEGKPGLHGMHGIYGEPGYEGPVGAEGVSGKDGSEGVPGASGKPGKDGVYCACPERGSNGYAALSTVASINYGADTGNTPGTRPDPSTAVNVPDVYAAPVMTSTPSIAPAQSYNRASPKESSTQKAVYNDSYNRLKRLWHRRARGE